MVLSYSSEKNVLQLIALLKAHSIKKIVASPGGTNIPFVGSVQNDPYFEIYSCVDERSAAYMACGLAAETGEPVVISCTGATAARNYPSALTEAFYSKLPILAVTSSQFFGRLGQLHPQFSDRNARFNDIATLSVQIPCPHSQEDYWANNIKLNSALLQLRRNEGGPVHINLETFYVRNFTVTELPQERVIRRYFQGDKFPGIDAKKICIFVGSHKRFSKSLEQAIDEFCKKYNAMVLCDQTSNYKGEFRILGGLVSGQTEFCPECRKADLVIHIGEISGSYFSFNNSKIWRVNKDGEIRDTFKKLTDVFEMEEKYFFDYYNNQKSCISCDNTYYKEWKEELVRVENLLPDLPLSNAWLCKVTAPKLPENSVLHLGILNSLRSWNLFDVPKSVYTYSNVGGFGIDGVLSTCVGASLANKGKLYFCVLGDLATFYDLNILGNRHIGRNLRIIVCNNGTGYEMHCPRCVGYDFPSDDIDKFFAAGGHFGRKSREVLKHFATDLGFEYRKAESQEEYLTHLDYLVSSEMHDKPLILEVFVNPEDDDLAYKATSQTITSTKRAVQNMARNVLGPKNYMGLKKILRGE